MFNLKQIGWRPGGVEEVRLKVAVAGTTLVVNGDEFDFSFMEPGSELPLDALGSEVFRSDVTCDEDGVVSLTVAVPYGPTPTEAEVYPPVLDRVTDGVVIDVVVPALVELGVEMPDKAEALREARSAASEAAEAESPVEERQDGQN